MGSGAVDQAAQTGAIIGDRPAPPQEQGSDAPLIDQQAAIPTGRPWNAGRRWTTVERNFEGRIGWGTWIRTKTNGVRVRSSTVKLSPSNAFPSPVAKAPRRLSERVYSQVGPARLPPFFERRRRRKGKSTGRIHRAARRRCVWQRRGDGASWGGRAARHRHPPTHVTAGAGDERVMACHRPMALTRPACEDRRIPHRHQRHTKCAPGLAPGIIDAFWARRPFGMREVGRRPAWRRRSWCDRTAKGGKGCKHG